MNRLSVLVPLLAMVAATIAFAVSNTLDFKAAVWIVVIGLLSSACISFGRMWNYRDAYSRPREDEQ